jgi:DNA-binding CsgD family transcriptional regulator
VLTTRELEVLRLAAKLRTDRQIGDELFISRSTVSRHIEHILGKLDVNTRHEAVAAARALGIL